MVTLKSSLLNLITRASSCYIEVLTSKAVYRGCLVVTLKSSLIRLFTKVPSDYIELVTSKAVYKGA